jgi:hypothetical protein
LNVAMAAPAPLPEKPETGAAVSVDDLSKSPATVPTLADGEKPTAGADEPPKGDNGWEAYWVSFFYSFRNF